MNHRARRSVLWTRRPRGSGTGRRRASQPAPLWAGRPNLRLAAAAACALIGTSGVLVSTAELFRTLDGGAFDPNTVSSHPQRGWLTSRSQARPDLGASDPRIAEAGRMAEPSAPRSSSTGGPLGHRTVRRQGPEDLGLSPHDLPAGEQQQHSGGGAQGSTVDPGRGAADGSGHQRDEDRAQARPSDDETGRPSGHGGDDPAADRRRDGDHPHPQNDDHGEADDNGQADDKANESPGHGPEGHGKGEGSPDEAESEEEDSETGAASTPTAIPLRWVATVSWLQSH